MTVSIVRAALFAAVGLLACVRPADAGTRIVAYVTGWESPPAIDPAKLTHLRSLKAKNPQLKVLLSVGGWEAEGFSDAALSAASRATFAGSVVALLREHSLDGVDLDWEYPGQGVAGIKSRPQDRQNFTALLQTMRAQLGERYLLTIASADREYFEFTQMDRLHVYLGAVRPPVT